MENQSNSNNRQIYIINVITIIVLILVLIAFFFKFVMPFMGVPTGAPGGGTYFKTGSMPSQHTLHIPATLATLDIK